MKPAGWIMDGDPLMPPEDEFVDWGMQMDGAYLMPSLQSADEPEPKRCFGIQRDEPCGCRKLSFRSHFVTKADVKTGERTEYGHAWEVIHLEGCNAHPVKRAEDYKTFQMIEVQE